MKNGFRQSMAWLHTWSGLVVGWILFAIFLTGTASYFRPEISYWMRPEQHRPGARAFQPRTFSAQPIMDHLASVAPAGFTLNLPEARNPVATAFWRDPTAGPRGFRQAVLDPTTGDAITGRDTRGGEFFYRLHFQLHYMSPIWGRWIVSLCALFMLVAIISGIIMHKRIFVDFFTFRPRKGQRSWMDAHALTAVLALPYHLMITYTGLVTLMIMFLPWGAQVAYDGNLRTFNAEVFGPFESSPAPAAPVALVAIDPLLHEASALWGGAPAARVTLSNPARGMATVEVSRGNDARLSTARDTVVFDARTGALLRHEVRDTGTAKTYGVFYGLHLGRFAQPLLRALFFLSGLAGTAMVATGTVLWAVKARQAAARKGAVGAGTWLVEILNLGSIAGLPMAMAAFFWLNRLLPPDLAGRSEWEVDGFFIAWGLCFAHAALRRGRRRGWVEQFALAAALGLGLPVLNAFTTASHLGVTLPAGDWLLAGFDLTVAALGLCLAATAWYLARRPAARTGRGTSAGTTTGANNCGRSAVPVRPAGPVEAERARDAVG